ncbi:hypothetical protein C8J56DRAFT_910947 [Mycena floridula]|nr:hypothetical protein C8J56DRAFT_910947 [Mycena floridula]
MYLPRAAFETGLASLHALETDILPKLQMGPNREALWRETMASLQQQTLPQTVIALTGATGSGKSSLINALLEKNLVPTSGTNACTSVVITATYHDKDTIDAEISFLSVEDWKAEVSVLLGDLEGEDGSKKLPSDLKSESGIAWNKISAAYPSKDFNEIILMSVDEILDIDEGIRQALGTSRLVSHPSTESRGFLKAIVEYIAPPPGRKKQSPKAAAWWPLIRQVNIRYRSPVLSNGVVIVDLPGTGDANLARSNIAQEYMKRCNYVWVVAPVTRAVDEQAAREILNARLATELAMDGNFDSKKISFIVTKCDDILPSEYDYSDDPDFCDLEDKISQAHDAIAEIGEDSDSDETQTSTISESDVGRGKKRNPGHVSAGAGQPNTKRRRISDSETSFIAAGENDNDSQFGPSLSQSTGYTRRRLQKELESLQIKKRAFCSSQRSKTVTDGLVDQFRAMWTELQPEELETAAESVRLPVFTVSSRDYAKIRGISKDDIGMLSFPDEESTQIPRVQLWIQHLADHTLRVATRNFLSEVYEYLGEVMDFIVLAGKVEPADTVELQEKWETRPTDIMIDEPDLDPVGISAMLNKKFVECLKEDLDRLKSHVRHMLKPCCDAGQASATRKLIQQRDLFVAGKAWNTYYAVIRRFGLFGDHNFNSHILYPFTKEILPQWTLLFNGTELLQPLQSALTRKIEDILRDVVDSVSPGLRDRAEIQRDSTLERAKGDLERIIRGASDFLNNQRKDLWRSIERDHVKGKLHQGYQGAIQMSARGKGSFHRRKRFFHDFIYNSRDEVFADVGDYLLNRINASLDDHHTRMQKRCRDQAFKVEIRISALWNNLDAPDSDSLQTAKRSLKRLGFGVKSLLDAEASVPEFQWM